MSNPESIQQVSGDADVEETQEIVFENSVRETESSFPAETEDVDSSISAFLGLVGPMREGNHKFNWKTV